MTNKNPNITIELILLALLALLWGSTYLFLKVAVSEIPPVTLIAIRTSVAALFLAAVMKLQGKNLPRNLNVWRKLFIQSFFLSFGAWTLLAWGQQFVDASLTTVLNSTSPIFVFLFTLLITRHEETGFRRLSGAALGLGGVVLIVGINALSGLGEQVAGQLAAVAGAMMYGWSAIYAKNFANLGATVTATASMSIAAMVLIPASLIIDQPWTLDPSPKALGAALALAFFSTGVALLIYFRLARTPGSLGVASQAYLRSGVGVALGVIFLGETITPIIAIGLAMAVAGVVLINFPARRPTT